MSETRKAGGKKPAASRKKASGKEAGKKSTPAKSTAKPAGASKGAAKSTGAGAAATAQAKAAAGPKPKAAVGKRRGGNGVSPDERWRRIAEAAYLLAERRGFQGGDPVADWLAAEAEVDATLRH